MKKNAAFFVFVLLSFLAGPAFVFNSFAQCATSGAPTYSSGCSAEYFQSISASGTTVVSTISLVGGTCSGTYFNDYATQGVTITAGNTLNITITRYTTTYTGFLSVYVDWNNDGTYALTELAGTMQILPATTYTTTYSFPVTASGVVTGTNLHMRVFLSEVSTGAPCTANYGQTFDYYLQVNCPSTPTVSVTPSSTAICNGSNTSFTASGAGAGGTYSWSPATGLSATTGASVLCTPATTTVYTVSGAVASGCPMTPSTATVTVNPVPTTSVTASGSLTFCRVDSVTFTQPSSAGISYQWYNGTAAIPGATTHSYTDTGAGAIRLVASNVYGCHDTSSSFTVSVFSAPPVSISPSHDTTHCDSIVLTVTSGPGVVYQWYKNTAAVSGATNASYTAHSSGSYYCSATVPGFCTGNSSSINVTLHVATIPVISYTSKTLRVPGTYLTYQWYENGVLIPGATHDTDVAHSNGNYTVAVTDSFGCTATSAPYTVSKLAIQQLGASAEVSIYPNPATNNVYIVAPVPVEAVITDAFGKVMIKQKSSGSIDISHLPAGMYNVGLFDDSGKRLLVQKLVKN